MGSVNKVFLIGHLGKDPELRYTPNGTAVCNFSIAMSESWKDKDGNKQEKTEWMGIVVWKKQAEACGEYLHKGSQVHVEGKIQTRQWEDRDGNKRYTTEVVANSVVFLTPKKDGGQQQSRGGGGDGHNYGPPPMTGDDNVAF